MNKPFMSFATESWMGDLSASISGRTLHELRIPGSHNSGSDVLGSSVAPGKPQVYAAVPCIIRGWSECQVECVLEQLRAGCRYIDLRTAAVKGKLGLRIVHGLVGRPVRDGRAKKTAPADEKTQRRRDAAAQREQLKPLRAAAARWEKEAERLRGIIAVIDKGLSAPGLYEKDPKTATDLQIKRARAVDLLDTAEMNWLEAEEAIELAQADALVRKVDGVGDIASAAMLDGAGPHVIIEGRAVRMVRAVGVDAFLDREIGPEAADQGVLGIKAAAQEGGCNHDQTGAAH